MIKKLLLPVLVLAMLLAGAAPLQANVCDQETTDSCTAPGGLAIVATHIDGDNLRIVVSNSNDHAVSTWIVAQVHYGGTVWAFQRRVVVPGNTTVTYTQQAPGPITLLHCAYLCEDPIGDDPDPIIIGDVNEGKRPRDPS